MAAAAAAAPPTAMSRLLAQARLTSFHPAISQIYTAPASYQSRGDFGLKRPLPTADLAPGTIRYVAVDELDTQDDQTPWRERERDVLVLKRWHEAGAKLRVSKPLTSTTTRKGDEIPAGALGLMPRSSYDRSTHLPLPNAKSRAAAAAAASAGPQPATMVDAYGPASGTYKETIPTMPDYLSMTDSQFEAFLGKLRSARPELRRFLTEQNLAKAKDRYLSMLQAKRAAAVAANERAKSTGATPVKVPKEISSVSQIPSPDIREANQATDMWGEGRSTQTDQPKLDAWLRRRNFLSSLEARDRSLPISKSRQIQALNVRRPYAPLHAHAGIQYSQPDMIYTQLLAEPIPGRSINETDGYADRGSSAYRQHYSREDNGHAVATGGRISYATKTQGDGLDTIDLARRDPEKGVKTFRIVEASREAMPGGVPTGKASDTRATEPEMGYIASRIRASAEEDGARSARGYPGTARWIGELNLRPVARRRGLAGAGAGASASTPTSKRPGEIYTAGERARAERRAANRRGGVGPLQQRRIPSADEKQKKQDLFTKLGHLMRKDEDEASRQGPGE